MLVNRFFNFLNHHWAVDRNNFSKQSQGQIQRGMGHLKWIHIHGTKTPKKNSQPIRWSHLPCSGSTSWSPFGEFLKWKSDDSSGFKKSFSARFSLFTNQKKYKQSGSGSGSAFSPSSVRSGQSDRRCGPRSFRGLRFFASPSFPVANGCGGPKGPHEHGQIPRASGGTP